MSWKVFFRASNIKVKGLTSVKFFATNIEDFFLFINNQWHRYVSNIIQQFATFKRKRRCQNIVNAVISINNSTSRIFVEIKIDYVFLLKPHTSNYHQNESLCDTATIRRWNVWIGCAWPESRYRRKGNYCIYCL